MQPYIFAFFCCNFYFLSDRKTNIFIFIVCESRMRKKIKKRKKETLEDFLQPIRIIHNVSVNINLLFLVVIFSFCPIGIKIDSFLSSVRVAWGKKFKNLKRNSIFKDFMIYDFRCIAMGKMLFWFLISLILNRSYQTLVRITYLTNISPTYNNITNKNYQKCTNKFVLASLLLVRVKYQDAAHMHKCSHIFCSFISIFFVCPIWEQIYSFLSSVRVAWEKKLKTLKKKL